MAGAQVTGFERCQMDVLSRELDREAEIDIRRSSADIRPKKSSGIYRI